jgi:hypothetical protein
MAKARLIKAVSPDAEENEAEFMQVNNRRTAPTTTEMVFFCQ